MTLIDRQIETIALACAVTPETVRAVIDGQRVGDGPAERVRAALSLIGYIATIPRVAMPCVVRTVVREVEHNGVKGIAFYDKEPV